MKIAKPTWYDWLLGFIFAGFMTALWMAGAHAAGTPNSYIVPQTPSLGATNFVAGTDTAGTYKTIYTGGTNGSKCFALMLNWNDQVATHLISIEIVHSSTAYNIAAFTTFIGLAGGVFGVPINLFSSAIWPGLPTDVSGNPYIYLNSGDTLKATFATTITTSNVINLVAQCGDF